MVLSLACYTGTDFETSSTIGETVGDGDGDSGGDFPGDGDGDGDPGDGDGDTTTGDGDGDDPAGYCVEVINMYRATLALPPLERWVDAEMCSNSEAQSDSMTNTPHGAFGQCGEYAQNECPGWPGPPASLLDGCLAQMWAEGPGEPFSEHGHYINMSSPDYTKVACGFYQTGQGSYWGSAEFPVADR